MSWVIITAIILGIVTLVCLAVKLYLKQKVEEIDGLGGVHTGESNIIASIGSKNSRKKGR